MTVKNQPEQLFSSLTIVKLIGVKFKTDKGAHVTVISTHFTKLLPRLKSL